jgi:hypothetical protein
MLRTLRHEIPGRYNNTEEMGLDTGTHLDLEEILGISCRFAGVFSRKRPGHCSNVAPVWCLINSFTYNLLKKIIYRHSRGSNRESIVFKNKESWIPAFAGTKTKNTQTYVKKRWRQCIRLTQQTVQCLSRKTKKSRWNFAAYRGQKEAGLPQQNC